MIPLSEDERALLAHISRWGSDGYPVSKLGSDRWQWGPWRSIKGPPRIFRSKKQAIENFEIYLAILRERLAHQRTAEERPR